MMNSKTYISDPKIWENFYKNMVDKKFNPYKYKPKQIGRGVRSRKSYVIPIRPHSQLENIDIIPQVTPVAAVEERAKTEHLKDVNEGVPFVKVGKGIKRSRNHSPVIPSKKLKTSTSQKGKKTNVIKKISAQKKKPLITKKKTNGKTGGISKKRQISGGKKSKKKQLKTLQIDSYKNIFKQLNGIPKQR